MLDPSFATETVRTLDTVPVYARGVDGSDYMPGLIGLNNIKNTDFVNVVVQSLARVPPLRDFFLLPDNYKHCKSPLVIEFGALIRKVWSPHNFKGQVSPHELLQAIMHASGNRFKIGNQADPMDFQAWLLNALHTALGGTKKPGSSIIHKTFQGTVKVITHKADDEGDVTEQERCRSSAVICRYRIVTSPCHLPVTSPLRDAAGDAVPLPHRRRAARAALQGCARAEHHPAGPALCLSYKVRRHFLPRNDER